MMPAAPIKAARRALDAAGLKIADMAAIKSHNPFVVNDIAFARETGADLMAMNNYGCSLVWGHPQGPTGVRGVIELIEELALRGGGYRPVPRLRRRRHRDGCGRRSHGRRMSDARLVGADEMPPVPPTLAHLLIDAARRAPDAEALVCGDDPLSYTQYLNAVAGFANGLQREGLRGERIALLLGNSIEMAVASFAVHMAGAQAVLLNPAYTARELAVDRRGRRSRRCCCTRRPTLRAGRRDQDAQRNGAASLISRSLAISINRRRHPAAIAPDARHARHPAIHRRHHRPSQGRQPHASRHRHQCRAARGAAADAPRRASASFA